MFSWIRKFRSFDERPAPALPQKQPAFFTKKKPANAGSDGECSLNAIVFEAPIFL
ncbi:hypothetical protein B4135_3056 [Caldibacillus debilis]|uniref:Uncharacterized protein n=1 Tax=Caldibacillus debilis TaxID=301148 RepID=A0A150LL54_9BACI|nr:hypothetical protein B4135_3056 [Caldibacillus debilis]